MCPLRPPASGGTLLEAVCDGSHDDPNAKPSHLPPTLPHTPPAVTLKPALRPTTPACPPPPSHPQVRPRELEEVLRMEYRSKLLNPKWAEAMASQGSGGAFEISQRMTAMLGWGATVDFRCVCVGCRVKRFILALPSEHGWLLLPPLPLLVECRGGLGLLAGACAGTDAETDVDASHL